VKDATVPDVPIVIVSCGSKKSKRPSRAEDMYTGAFFRVQLNYAKSLVPSDCIYILSAKHGFIPLDKVISPYNVKMGDPSSVKIETLKIQASELNILDSKKVICIGGSLYTDICKVIWSDCICPLSHVEGAMGHKMKWMKEQSQKKLS
jgi:hypothetical protein